MIIAHVWNLEKKKSELTCKTEADSQTALLLGERRWEGINWGVLGFENVSHCT